MPSSTFEKIVIYIIKSFFIHCRPQMSFSKLEHCNSEIMHGDRDRNFQSRTVRDDYCVVEAVEILKLPNSTNSGALAISSRRCQQHVMQQYKDGSAQAVCRS